METQDVMKKHKLEKQGVYDRRFALNKKIKAAGLSAETLTGNKVIAEKAQPKKTRTKKAQPEKSDAVHKEDLSERREGMVVDKQVPVVMKPIEINFGNFTIKLNGVPKSMSVNPDTNAIEIN